MMIRVAIRIAQDTPVYSDDHVMAAPIITSCGSQLMVYLYPHPVVYLYPQVIYDSKDVVLSLPPIINGKSPVSRQ